MAVISLLALLIIGIIYISYDVGRRCTDKKKIELSIADIMIALLTLICIGYAIYVFNKSTNSIFPIAGVEAAQTGDFIAGFAGSLAFIWLVAGFHLQRKELKEQREEFQVMNKFNAIEAISRRIDKHELSIEVYIQKMHQIVYPLSEITASGMQKIKLSPPTIHNLVKKISECNELHNIIESYHELTEQKELKESIYNIINNDYKELLTDYKNILLECCSIYNYGKNVTITSDALEDYQHKNIPYLSQHIADYYRSKKTHQDLLEISLVTEKLYNAIYKFLSPTNDNNRDTLSVQDIINAYKQEFKEFEAIYSECKGLIHKQIDRIKLYQMYGLLYMTYTMDCSAEKFLLSQYPINMEVEHDHN